MKLPSFLPATARQESAYLDDGLAIAVRDKGTVAFERADFLSVDASASADKTRSTTGFAIGGRFCRFVSLPWSELLLDSAAAAAYYHSAFTEVYGDVAPGTSFAAADEARGQARVVCALEPSLVDAVQAWAASHGRRVAFIRPAVQVAFASFRAQMQGEAGFFALREATELSLLCWEAGRVAEVDVFPIDGRDWRSRLDDEVTRARLQSGNAGVLYVADAWSGDAEIPGGDAIVLSWPAFATAAPNPMSRLATCGL